MQISKGVEWAAHACALLTVLPEKKGLRAEAIATYLDVPGAYMAKQMQALRRGGVVASVRGQRGGYCLTRAASDISLWDVTAAIEGHAPAFRCTEIRQQGPCGSDASRCTRPCAIAAAFHGAERAFREHLSRTSIADIAVRVLADAPPEQMEAILAWTQENAH